MTTTMGSVVERLMRERNETVERLENEIETLRARVAELEGRLQVDPGGSDKIDELEQSVLHLRARIAELEAPPVVPEGCVIERLEDGKWWASRLGWLLTSAEQAAAYRALAWAIEHDQRPPHAGDK